jgi:hypothetical protein
MNKHQNKNDQKLKSINLVENKNNGAKNNLEKLDEKNENLDEKIENETGERNDVRIMNFFFFFFLCFSCETSFVDDGGIVLESTSPFSMSRSSVCFWCMLSAF